MPSRLTPLQAGNFYHIYNRGNNRQNIFFERENYIHFLCLMRKYLVTNGVDILAYCLMPNHYHFLVYLRDDNLSAAMHRLAVAYTKGINKRFDRCGALFQGRFQSIHVNDTNYLIHLSRYIHLNPVAAGFVDRSEEWEFSQYGSVSLRLKSRLVMQSPPTRTNISKDICLTEPYWEFSSYSEYAGLRSGTLPQMEYLKLQFQNEIDREFLIDNNLQQLLLDW